MEVKIYTTPTCPYCKMTEEFLKENNIKFEDIDVSSNPDAVQEMMEKTGQLGVPAIEIDENIITGFNKDKLKELLNIQ